MSQFGIAPRIAAEPKVKAVREDAPRPILSRLPVEMDQTGLLVVVPFGEPSDDDEEPVPPLMRLTTPSSVFYTQSRLPSLAPDHILLWNALHNFGPQRQDYAAAFARVAHTAPHPLPQDAVATACPVSDNESYIRLIPAVFNYTTISLPATTPRHEYYAVLFRSTRNRTAAPSSIRGLYAADRFAHEEAVPSGGLLMYWYGIPNAQGENVATCVWTSRNDALIASRLEKHRAAVELASGVYETYEVVRYVLKVEAGKIGVEAWK